MENNEKEKLLIEISELKENNNKIKSSFLDVVKALNCLYAMLEILTNDSASIDELCDIIVGLTFPSWEEPHKGYTRAIVYNKEYKSPDFRVTEWKQLADVIVEENIVGKIEIYYLEETPENSYTTLVDIIALLLGKIIEQKLSKDKLKKANEEISRATKLKDEFLANMSHELRTPLTAIIGLSSSLIENVYGNLTQGQYKALNTILTSSNHLFNLITEILDFVKIGVDKLELKKGIIPIEKICKDSIDIIAKSAEEKRINISLNIQDGLKEIEADFRRFKQILIKLLDNAVNVTPEHGEIGIDVSVNGEFIEFKVWDTGIGIKPEDVSNLFKPFVQLDARLTKKHYGVGLGLSMVERLIKLHGGNICVESEFGKGSSFTISLPNKIKDKKKIDYYNKEQRKICTILVVDDETDNLMFICDYLSVFGHKVFVAHDGFEAVERARELEPDIIFMDIHMPVLDGIEATKNIRLYNKNVPIIAITAFTISEERDASFVAGVNDYIIKPFSLEELTNVIEKYAR
ncbi:MAG: response regulator [Desulfobacterales bacterium]|nr:response regulator [Desulfobacterales bacterium]